MSDRFNASICLTDLVNAYNAGHSAMRHSDKNGKVYVSITGWVRDEDDQFGNNLGIQLNSTQKGEAEDLAKNGGKKIYIGNGKFTYDSTTAAPAQPMTLNGTGGQPATGAPANGQPWQQGNAATGDDCPF